MCAGNRLEPASLPAVQSLWIGARLSRIEQLCVESFLGLGYPFHLYVYDEVTGVPPGAVVCDAARILPREALFTCQSGLVSGSIANFADLFRYKLLAEQGGWWVDMDVIGLRPLPKAIAEVAGWEDDRYVSNAVLYAPVGSPLMETAYVQASRDERRFLLGTTGPEILTRLLREFGQLECALPTHAFYPVHWSDFRRVLEPCQPLPQESYTLHLWNQLWQQNRLDKDCAIPPDVHAWTSGKASQQVYGSPDLVGRNVISRIHTYTEAGETMTGMSFDFRPGCAGREPGSRHGLFAAGDADLRVGSSAGLPSRLKNMRCCQGSSSNWPVSFSPLAGNSLRICCLLILCSGLIGTFGSSARNSTRAIRPCGFSALRIAFNIASGWENSW